MTRLIWTASGALFGLGLWLSGMTEPARVQGWFDVAGAWDPTLAFVLTGALIPMLVAWRIAARRKRSFTGAPLPAAPETQIDTKLVGGSALFGFGWALAGLCPGPALAALGWSGVSGFAFSAAMVAGMALWNLIGARRPRAVAA
ncbi:hypothetical protein SAMN05877809_101143 [Rhodobacter sp. JA431]|uniref:DUF6691 family protein n=1 Tax=Rhodobacter sp. JA431 TaxID=570013 RepID=UPI000BC4C58A|nr:DUF6691 family protein [Rhodobacter sp. JA431]SOB90199.1 hypothetical protein SAMN05877809_101143 [Rhodobacter sp. JA431]